jgi:predicted nucleic acid-binding protein
MVSVSIDTNILVYAADPEAGERHHRAMGVLIGGMRANTVLTQQVLGEFYNVLNKSGLDLANGLATAERLQRRMRLERTVPEDLLDAFHLAQASRMQFWDAVIVTVCRRARVDILLTEDVQDGRVYGSLRIVNPFVDDNLDQIGFLLST